MCAARHRRYLVDICICFLDMDHGNMSWSWLWLITLAGHWLLGPISVAAAAAAAQRVCCTIFGF
jgi:hypothetical protein